MSAFAQELKRATAQLVELAKKYEAAKAALTQEGVEK